MPTITCRTWHESTVARKRLWTDIAAWEAQSAMPLKFVTYNGLHFDGPVLETHQRLDGLRLFGLDLRKYGSKNVIDLYDVLTFGDNCGEAILYRKLTAMAQHFGIPTPADDIAGEDVADYIAKGDYETVAAHCAEDVRMTAALFLRLGMPYRAVVFDLETVGKDGIDRSLVRPDGRVKEPAKVEASIAERLGKAGLDPFANRIVVIGYEFIDAPPAGELRVISEGEVF